MKEERSIQDELEKLSPFLAKMKERDSGFRVPEGYFQSLPDAVLKKVTSTAAEPNIGTAGRVMPLQGRWQFRRILSMAAAILLLVVVFCLLRNNKKASAEMPVAEAILRSIPDEVLHSYLIVNAAEFDNTIILETHYSARGTALPSPTIPDDSELEQYLESIIDDIDLEDFAL